MIEAIRNLIPQAARGNHTFHIPVMGTGFTIDTPVKVARYGISSVISIVDDNLIEDVRRCYCGKEGLPYEPISSKDEDSRARRITAYLNLVRQLVMEQVRKLKSSLFVPGSEITRYFDLLPEGSLKTAYRRMLCTNDPAEKDRLDAQLRQVAEPGSIDVNIMTKLDRDTYRAGQKLPPEFSDALAALRGFAKSDLESSVVLSAGLNQRLYSYVAHFPDFFPNNEGRLRKKIIIKVSDFRSAEIQGKFLAKKGLWVSEYRIESGLNCGGHAFATKGHLMGPILEEFKTKREDLRTDLHAVYNKGLAAAGHPTVDNPFEMRITVQGGIGTHSEDAFLLRYYQVDGTGWATPFLLVPEVANMDPEHLEKLCAAGEDDVFLSNSSPLGVPFWNLRNSASEINRAAQAEEGNPGSPCPKRCLVSTTEFSEMPLCLASQVYQKKKLESLENENLTPDQYRWLRDYVLGKSCLCRDLAGAVERVLGMNPNSMPAICCGPNIVNFSKISTLEEMVSHIYGRLSLMTNPDRPHMFIRELKIYIDYLRREVEKHFIGLSNQTPAYFKEFKETLRSGIDYYHQLVEKLDGIDQPAFIEKLKDLAEELEWMTVGEPAPTT